MFMHPQMQRSLYKTLRKIGKTNQIIYSTHSPHFSTGLQRGAPSPTR